VIWGVTRGGSFFNVSVGRKVNAPHVATWVNIRGLFGVVFYACNWLAASGTSLPLAFTHLWSLSVEEQFYLFWPLLLLFMLRTGRLRMMVAVSALLVVASVVLAGLHSPANGYAWSYFGTDSRAQELLLGALLVTGRSTCAGTSPAMNRSTALRGIRRRSPIRTTGRGKVPAFTAR
jgi:peptidoglycan/LPS O-acetylase OafA/YrhL